MKVYTRLLKQMDVNNEWMLMTRATTIVTFSIFVMGGGGSDNGHINL